MGTCLAANLRLACSYHRSVSDVCRKIGINRSQFMKYLSAEATPSRRNLRRICDFFGCDEVEMTMSPEHFAQLIRLRPKRQLDGIEVPPLMLDLLSSAQRQKAAMSKLLGYYYQYYMSFSVPGHILQALLSVYPAHGLIAYKRVERLKLPGIGLPPIFKYSGLVSVVGDRFHMLDLETVNRNELTQSILFPTYRNRVTTLTGLTMGVSGNDAHQPCASRVVLQYLGPAINMRAALSECRLHDVGSEEVPAWIRSHLTAVHVESNPGLIRARAL